VSRLSPTDNSIFDSAQQERLLYLQDRTFGELSIDKYPDAILPVFVTGGIGDNILAVPLLHELAKDFRLEVYSHHVNAYNYFKTDLLPDGLSPFIPNYSYYLTVNSVLKMIKADHFNGYKSQAAEMLAKSIASYSSTPDIERMVKLHPLFDGRLTALAVESGYDRRSFPFAFLGKAWPGPYKKRIRINRATGAAHPYITIHNGYETKLKFKIGNQSTKNVPAYVFESFVGVFKKEFPDVKVIQLGASTSQPISGVDDCRIAGTSVTESFDILAGSLCHVDIESGLVHAAYALDVPSVVLFGPTPVAYFGYEENTNLVTNACRNNCFWLKDSWMEKCILGYLAPKCMDAFDPMDIFDKVCDVIRDKRN
jgi:ADP-heptose:LPS heptosyltransferase